MPIHPVLKPYKPIICTPARKSQHGLPFHRPLSVALLLLGVLTGVTLQTEAATRYIRRVQPRQPAKSSVQQKSSVQLGRPTASPFAPVPGASVTLTNQLAPETITTGGEIHLPPKRKLIYVRRSTPPPSPEKIEAERQKVQASTVSWLQQRADAGSERAQFALGMRYLKGDGVERDIEAGRALLRKALDNGYAPAEQELRKSAQEFPSWAVKSKPSR